LFLCKINACLFVYWGIIPSWYLINFFTLFLAFAFVAKVFKAFNGLFIYLKVNEYFIFRECKFYLIIFP